MITLPKGKATGSNFSITCWRSSGRSIVRKGRARRAEATSLMTTERASREVEEEARGSRGALDRSVESRSFGATPERGIVHRRSGLFEDDHERGTIAKCDRA